jgi:putative methyltransferase (TIGR04325 family)
VRNSSYRPERLVETATATVRPLIRALRATMGRFHYMSPIRPRFQGAFDCLEAAVASVPSRSLVGYDHDVVAEVSFDEMCRIAPWDYPIMFWLQRLLPRGRRILDAGGHMGTKYRAFRRLLDLDAGVEWTVYDVPAIVRAGRRRALEDGLVGLAFTEDLAQAPCPDIFLASGLLQYLDVPFSELLRRLAALPRHVLVNKVAMRDEKTIVTLENFGVALVPYQIRNREAFLSEMATLGYRIEDEWHIPSLAHRISTHPELGWSRSSGFYFTKDEVSG